MNEIKQTLQQDADALLKRLQQSRKNGTGVTLGVSDVGVLCEEIESLKARIAKVESGEFVVVPKEPTEAMIKHAYGTYEGATILPYSFYKAMIEAAQENSYE